MVACKYYLAGRCQYGNNCKYDHVEPREYYDNENYRHGSKQSASYHRGGQPSGGRFISPMVSAAPITASSRHSSNYDPNRFRWVSPSLQQSASISSQAHRRDSNTTSVMKLEEPVAQAGQIRRQRMSSGSITDEESLL